jgi:hypothetical protein
MNAPPASAQVSGSGDLLIRTSCGHLRELPHIAVARDFRFLPLLTRSIACSFSGFFSLFDGFCLGHESILGSVFGDSHFH